MKMNKRGFTLVELLAVVVILAIVMLVGVTAIGPLIENSRKGAFESTAQAVLQGAENYVLAKQMENPNYVGGCVAIGYNASETKVAESLSALGYFDDKGNKYYGTVSIDCSGTNCTYIINMTDKKYYIANKTDTKSIQGNATNTPATFTYTCA